MCMGFCGEGRGGGGGGGSMSMVSSELLLPMPS